MIGYQFSVQETNERYRYIIFDLKTVDAFRVKQLLIRLSNFTWLCRQPQSPQHLPRQLSKKAFLTIISDAILGHPFHDFVDSCVNRERFIEYLSTHHIVSNRYTHGYKSPFEVE